MVKMATLAQSRRPRLCYACAAVLRSQPRQVAALLGMAATDWSRDSAFVTPAHGPGVLLYG